MPSRTLESLYCESQRCTPAQFHHRVFWRCLYRHAIPFVWLVRLFRPGHFQADRVFISDAGQTRDIAEIRREVGEYITNPLNRGWLRRTAKIRVSAGRVIELAEEYLPPTKSGV